MSDRSCLEVHIKHTGESIRMACSPEVTVKNVIEYACENSVCATKMNYDDYYLSLNNMEMLDDDKTLEEIDIFRMEHPYLELYMKTAIRLRKMDLALQKLRAPLTQMSSHSNISGDPVRTDSITKTNANVSVNTIPSFLFLWSESLKESLSIFLDATDWIQSCCCRRVVIPRRNRRILDFVDFLDFKDYDGIV